MSRDTAVLAELDALTTRLRDGADAYVKQVRWVEKTWRDPKQVAAAGSSPCPPATDYSRAAGAGRAGDPAPSVPRRRS